MRELDKRKGMRTIASRTICEVHRQIYDLLVIRYGKEADDICDLLDEAFVMGIKMTRKLADYKYSMICDCKENPDVEEIERLRSLRIKLTGV